VADTEARRTRAQVVPGSCILYRGTYSKKDGYGRKWCSGLYAVTTAHRAVWIDTVGPVPEGYDVCHSCDYLYQPGDITYRRCINLDHLYLDTRSGNLQHMSDIGRAYMSHAPRNVGSLNGMAVLDETAVLEIRALREAGFTQGYIAKEFGVAQSTISRAVGSTFWRHI
jgi:hypothetical protein